MTVCNNQQLNDHVLRIVIPDLFVSSWKRQFIQKNLLKTWI